MASKKAVFGGEFFDEIGDIASPISSLISLSG
jgi:hypothetical protein